MPTENTTFSEDTLLEEIEKIWGKYGAHADLYKYILKRLKAAEDVITHLDSTQVYVVAGPAYWNDLAHYISVRDYPYKHIGTDSASGGTE